MKVRENGADERTYDPDGLTRRASCLCFRDDTEKEVILRSHRIVGVYFRSGLSKILFLRYSFLF